MTAPWVRRTTFFVSALGLFLLLGALQLTPLSFFWLGWAACTMWRWDKDDLLTFYRRMLPVARARLQKLDEVERLVSEGWTLHPPRVREGRHWRQEVADKMKLLRQKTDGREH